MKMDRFFFGNRSFGLECGEDVITAWETELGITVIRRIRVGMLSVATSHHNHLTKNLNFNFKTEEFIYAMRWPSYRLKSTNPTVCILTANCENKGFLFTKLPMSALAKELQNVSALLISWLWERYLRMCNWRQFSAERLRSWTHLGYRSDWRSCCAHQARLLFEGKNLIIQFWRGWSHIYVCCHSWFPMHWSSGVVYHRGWTMYGSSEWNILAGIKNCLTVSWEVETSWQYWLIYPAQDLVEPPV